MVQANELGSTSFADGPVKRRLSRATRACDFCHQRSIRCRLSETHPSSCQACLEHGRRCAYERPVKKRGVPASSVSSAPSAAIASALPAYDAASQDLRLPAELTHAILVELTVLLFTTGCPLLPCFRRNSLLDRIYREDYKHDRAFIIMLTALSGLVCAYIEDGSLVPKRTSATHQSKSLKAHALWQVAASACPTDPEAFVSLDLCRAAALLSACALQRHDAAGAKKYSALCCMNLNLHGVLRENKWSTKLTEQERQDRRCLVWGVYGFDVSNAMSLNAIPLLHEAYIAVEYPSALEYPCSLREQDTSAFRHKFVSHASDLWLDGWHFLFDVTRILEITLECRAASASQADRSLRSKFYGKVNSLQELYEQLTERYASLLARFKDVGQLQHEALMLPLLLLRTEIIVTLQLLPALTEEHLLPVGHGRLQVGLWVIAHVSTMPSSQLRLLGTVFQHKLATIGEQVALGFTSTLRNDSQRVEETKPLSIVFQFAKILRTLCASTAKMEEGHPGWHLKDFWSLEKPDDLMEDGGEELNRETESLPEDLEFIERDRVSNALPRETSEVSDSMKRPAANEELGFELLPFSV